MKKETPTIYDVAEKAGVSISTVSRVLNNPSASVDLTRQKVMQAVQMLGFVPKAEASALARKHVGSIGVILPFFTSPSYVQRMRGIASALGDTEFELIVYSVRDRAQLQGYLDVLPLRKRLDGLIVMSMPLDAKQADHLHRHGVEVVCIEFNDPRFGGIEVDNEAGGRMAAEHLIQRGRRRFAYVGEVGIPDHIIHLSEQRLEGYARALSEAGYALNESCISRRQYSPAGAVAQANALLDLPDPPDAVFAYSDLHAADFLKVARGRGLRVPDDIAIVSFDGTDLSDYLELTTVDQRLEESGRLAAELLVSRIGKTERPPQNVRLSLELIARRTT
jgi:LacI family transcriptional regulator